MAARGHYTIDLLYGVAVGTWLGTNTPLLHWLDARIWANAGYLVDNMPRI